jgi:hypothetical protein
MNIEIGATYQEIAARAARIKRRRDKMIKLTTTSEPDTKPKVKLPTYDGVQYELED